MLLWNNALWLFVANDIVASTALLNLSKLHIRVVYLELFFFRVYFLNDPINECCNISAAIEYKVFLTNNYNRIK